MCTVSYVPIADGFILTSNRDESSRRSASLVPDFYNHEGLSLYYPKDPQGNGSWIAASEDERVVCLLNGAFHSHVHQPPYNRSRGLVVIEAFHYDTPLQFYNEINLNGVEPFTLVMVWFDLLYEFRWDGINKHLLSLPQQPYLWASATLYSQDVVARKRKWLEDFLNSEKSINQEKMVGFHEHGGVLDPMNGMRIKRPNGLETLSITSIQMKEHEASIIQNNFVSDWFEDSWSSQLADERL